MSGDFDKAAKQYDQIFTFSNIGKAQRYFVFKYINSIISVNKKLSILELNCGTGHDAIQFAHLNHTVLATDISERMIEIAKKKTYPHHLEFKVQDINTITTQTFNRKFDLIFSNFGGLNCLSKKQLEIFFNNAIHLLNPKGKLVLVVMSKQCLWERLYFCLKGDFKNAERRQAKGSVLVDVHGSIVQTWYYNPKTILTLTESLYKPIQIKPIGITIPPSYLETSFLAKRPTINFLIGLERIINGSFWAKYADHFLIELAKK